MGISVVLPILNEVATLDETITILIWDNRERLDEILVVICDRTTASCLDVVERHLRENPGLLRVVRQTQPFLGGAMMAGIRESSGDRIVTLFADLESDPSLVRDMIEASDRNPGAIIQASRWMKNSRFQGYSRMKLGLNFIAQLGLRLAFARHVTDFTFGYRLYPSDIAKSIPVNEFRHGFVLEILLMAIRMKVPILEIPANWIRRTEGDSQSTLSTYLHYFPLACRARTRRIVPREATGVRRTEPTS